MFLKISVDSIEKKAFTHCKNVISKTFFFKIFTKILTLNSLKQKVLCKVLKKPQLEFCRFFLKVTKLKLFSFLKQETHLKDDAYITSRIILKLSCTTFFFKSRFSELNLLTLKLLSLKK